MKETLEVDMTAFQASEVQGLLDDPAPISGERRTWGRIVGGFGGHRLCLVVTDAAGAAEDLRRRADHLEDERERAGRNGKPAARSLRLLADRIAQARA